jgi:O-antigen/teichoic acid export membrane protein
MLRAILASLSVNIAANLLLVPRYGLMAAALVGLGSVLLYVAVVIIFTIRNFKRPRAAAPAGDE